MSCSRLLSVSYTHLDVYKRQIVALANSLNIEIIAEGVETQRQRERLHDLGCTYAQGYLFGRPAPPSQALAPPAT